MRRLTSSRNRKKRKNKPDKKASLEKVALFACPDTDKIENKETIHAEKEIIVLLFNIRVFL